MLCIYAFVYQISALYLITYFKNELTSFSYEDMGDRFIELFCSSVCKAWTGVIKKWSNTMIART